jgi:hypothetical protein
VKGPILPTAFVPFTMCATARDDHIHSFRTDLERLTVNQRGWAPLDVLKSTNTTALLRGAVPQSIHTATDASLAIYLQNRLVGKKDIHLDLVVTIQH